MWTCYSFDMIMRTRRKRKGGKGGRGLVGAVGGRGGGKKENGVFVRPIWLSNRPQQTPTKLFGTVRGDRAIPNLVSPSESLPTLDGIWGGGTTLSFSLIYYTRICMYTRAQICVIRFHLRDIGNMMYVLVSTQNRARSENSYKHNKATNSREKEQGNSKNNSNFIWIARRRKSQIRKRR